MPDVCLHESESALETPSNESETREIEHRRGSVDPHELDAGAREGKRDPASAATQFQHLPASVQGKIPPERHIAPTQCLRILPVVEGRVVIPALVTFHQPQFFCPTVANSMVCWISTNAAATDASVW